MKHIYRLAFCLGGAVTLAGCVEGPRAANQLPMEPSPSGPPFISTFDASVSDAAMRSCVAALDAQTDGKVRLVGTEFSQANSGVFMRVGENGAPWRCLVSNDGRGPELMFMGSEGAA